MEFEPDKITKEHVQKAILHIKENNVELIPATRYEVFIDGFAYPPKEVMRYAHAQMNGNHIWKYSGGEPTNKFLEKMGFKIIPKDANHDPIADLIERYKARNQKTKMTDEVYKWVLTKEYDGRPDLNAVNFVEEYKSIDYNNLLYPLAKGVGNHLARERTDAFRKQFQQLFDETTDLQERITHFNKVTFNLYREIRPKNTDSHHQDERTIATYLAYYDANKYPFYKDSFYRKYCELIGVKIKPTGQKYLHYIDLLNDLIENYITQDQELLDLKRECIPTDGHEDVSHYILAQDILFQMLDKKVVGERRYWRIGTSDDNGNYWEQMLESAVACVGWPRTGDLEDKNISSKKEIDKVLLDAGYKADDKRARSKQAGQLFKFYSEISIGDVVVAQNGQKVLGIGIVNNEYIYEEGLPFPHTKPTDWIIKNPENLINQKGLQTAVHELDDPSLIHQIDNLLAQKSTDIRSNIMDNKIQLNTILYGPPGTGKTFHTVDMAVKIAAQDSYKPDSHEANKEVFDRLVNEGQIVFTTFHQSMSYEDFIEGIKPLKPEKEDTFLKYDIEDGLFKKICAAAVTPNQLDFNAAYKNLQEKLTAEELIELKTPTSKTFAISLNSNGNLNLHTGTSQKIQGTLTKENIQKQISGDNIFEYWQGYFYGVIEYLKTEFNYNPDSGKTNQKFVLIIDEINRGNVAEIFGELITLIEEDKRQGKAEATKVELPYSKKPFAVPSNLYIIGTMNTADRSVEALDTALRRRFSFLEMMPDYDLPGLKAEIEGTSLARLLKIINQRIERILDRDHQIGHSYFLFVKNTYDLQQIFKDRIIPLLQEYFYGDYEKMGRVLGEGFIGRNGSNNQLFAKFSVEDPESYDSPIFEIKQEPLKDIDKFKEALILLYNNKAE